MGGRRNERLKQRIRRNQFDAGITVDQQVNAALRRLGEVTSVHYQKDRDNDPKESIRLGLVKL